MKSTRRPPGLSGSDWQRICQIVNRSGRYSPNAIAKREAAARLRFSRLEAGECVA